MALLKELYSKLKETDITFSRGAVQDDDNPPPAPDGDGDFPPPDSDVGDEEFAGPDEGGEFGDEEGDEETVAFDVPTLIKALEWAHEEAQDDNHLHEFTEALLGLGKDVITMEDFEEVVAQLGGGEDDGMGGDPSDPGEFGGDDEMTNDIPADGDDTGGGSQPPRNPQNEPISGAAM